MEASKVRSYNSSNSYRRANRDTSLSESQFDRLRHGDATAQELLAETRALMPETNDTSQESDSSDWTSCGDEMGFIERVNAREGNFV